MREDVTPERLAILMQALSASAPRGVEFRVYIVGGGTAILRGWRASSLDVDLAVDDDRVLRDIQRLKDELDINIELVEPTAFVPALQGAADRHVFIRKIKRGTSEPLYEKTFMQLVGIHKLKEVKTDS